jgi:F0F1-type ATP synthase assembly protein I
MDKEQILEKSRNSKQKEEEYTTHVSRNALIWGVLVGAVICFILEGYTMFVLRGNYWGYHSILFSIGGVTNILYYRGTKKKNNLVLGIIMSVIAIMSVYAFFLF